MTFKFSEEQIKEIKHNYCDLHMSIADIGRLYNASPIVIFKRLHDLNISTSLQLKQVKYTDEELIYKYLTLGYGLKELAKECECDTSVIKRILKQNGVVIRGIIESSKVSRKLEKIHNATYGLKRSPEAIENNRKAQLGKVMSAETRFKISQSEKGKYDVVLDLNDIVHKYYDLLLSTVDIANDYGCNSGTIAKRLKDAGYKLRDCHGDARTPSVIAKYRNSVIGQKRPSIAKENNCFWKKHLSPETIAKIKEARAKQTLKPEDIARRAKTAHLNWVNSSPEYKTKMSLRRGLAANIKPNKPETSMIKILNRLYPNEWQYTGNGKVYIEGLNPDFLNINGQKKIIEIFGLYWHGKKVGNYNRTVEGRKEVFSKYGYDTLIIWENEFKNIGMVIDKVITFNGENHKPKCEVQGILI